MAKKKSPEAEQPETKAPDVDEAPTQFDQEFPPTGPVQEVEDLFTPRAGKPENAHVHAALMDEAKDMANYIVRHVPVGFARNNALKALKEMLMWANEGVAKGR